ncbi:bifunctional DNA mismatch repair MutS family/DNA mismatch repair protein MutS [Babesia duncani]|uniref:Bifunctional DNA mismatch repair MutS family/DNA mismatch repair protein MutS n=1 Tax=Babesia duncani TaxID=323732 RepID=A0AAD9PM61_9APIC|nr:bifunctional DNA mismatch repair MutS family/DNA mismatch repair protein MutS [Babesia duncani]
MASLLVALRCLDLADSSIYKGKFTLDEYRIENRLSMDRAVFASLSILLKNSEGANDTLFKLLNKCRSPIGTRRLRVWIAQPLTDAKEISKRHDCVEAFTGSMYKLLQAECLRKVPDLDSLAFKYKSFTLGNTKGKSKPTFEDMVRLYDCIVAVNRTVKYVLMPYDQKHAKTIKETFTDPLLSIGSKFETYLRLVEKAIDLSQAESHLYVMNRNFDLQLEKLASDLDEIQLKIDQHRDQMQQELFNGVPGKIKIVKDNNMTFLFKSGKKDYQLIHDNKPNTFMEKVRLNKNEFIFTTPQLRCYCTKFASKLAEYELAQSSLVDKTLKVASTYWVLVEQYANVLATLDIMAAFAEVATIYNYVRPRINHENDAIHLCAARHPLVESCIRNGTVVPNDLVMNMETSRVHITTGPNMGGKSTYIRQVCC